MINQNNCQDQQQQQTVNMNKIRTNTYYRYLTHILCVVVILGVTETCLYFAQEDFGNIFHEFCDTSRIQLRTQYKNYQQSSITIDFRQYLSNPIQINQIVQKINSIDNKNISPNRLLQGQNSQDSNPPLARYILLIIIILFVVVPFVALILFGVIVLYKRLRGRDEENQENQNRPVEVQVDVNNFKIDQIGPYLSNPNDQCSICLDKQTNIRTYCGHFFHGQCLKAWYDKKTTDGRSPTCPICVGSQINPVKIYCKKCFVSVKLDTIYCETTLQKINELSEFKCNQCNDQTVGSQTTENIKKEEKNNKGKLNNDNNKNDQYHLQSAQKLYIDTMSI